MSALSRTNQKIGHFFKHLFVSEDEDKVAQETCFVKKDATWYAFIREGITLPYFKDFVAHYFEECQYNVLSENGAKVVVEHPKLSANITLSFGRTQSEERILQAHYETRDVTKIQKMLECDDWCHYYQELFNDFGYKLGHAGLLRGQTLLPLVEIHRKGSEASFLSSIIAPRLPTGSNLCTLEDHIKHCTVWNQKDKVWVAYLRSDCNKEDVRVLFLNFVEERSFKITRADTAIIEAESTTSGALKATVSMQIGCNHDNEKIVHIDYTEKMEFFEKTTFFKDYSKELFSHHYFKGQTNDLVKPTRRENSTSLYNHASDSPSPVTPTATISPQETLAHLTRSLSLTSIQFTPTVQKAASSASLLTPGEALKLQREIENEIRQSVLEEQILDAEEERLTKEEELLRAEEERLKMAVQKKKLRETVDLHDEKPKEGTS